MPTVIDALVVTLGLDPKAYKKGSAEARADLKKTREAGQQTGKDFEASAKRSMEAFASLRREVMSLFTAFTAGIGLKEFVADTANSEASVGRLSRSLGMSTQDVWAWQQAMQGVGGTAGDATAGLKQFANMAAQMHLDPGSFGQQAGWLRFLGLSPEDIQGDAGAALLKVGQNLRKIADPRDRFLAGRNVGLSDNLINLITSPDAAATIARLKASAPSDEDVQAAQRFQKQWGDLLSQLSKIRNTVANQLIPPLTDLMEKFAAWARGNVPMLTGALAGLAATAAALGIALAVDFLPFIAVGAAIGAAVGLLVNDFDRFKRGADSIFDWNAMIAGVNSLLQAIQPLIDAVADFGKQLFDIGRQAAPGLGAALQDLGSAMGPFIAVVAQIAAVFVRAFGPVVMSLIRMELKNFANSLRFIADVIRLVTDLLTGQWGKAWADAKAVAKDALKGIVDAVMGTVDALGKLWHAVNPAVDHRLPTPSQAPQIAPVRATPAAGPPPAGAAGEAIRMIKGFEGFTVQAKWDKNAYRAGYGSDTVTDPTTGKVSRVTATTRVSREQAEADIRRRVMTEFMPKAAAMVGAAWGKYSIQTRAALTSLAYNYGSLAHPALRQVLAAARAGDVQALAAAIQARQGDNGGQNARRRLAEAASVASPPAANGNLQLPTGRSLMAAQYGPAPANQTTISIDQITINTKATDAAGIAREIGPAIRQRGFVTQANSGQW